MTQSIKFMGKGEQYFSVSQIFRVKKSDFFNINSLIINPKTR
ncbi:hypothetical protein [Spirosoma oryzicola]|nr:hypothetical protein [Spirosoma oryzicola]